MTDDQTDRQGDGQDDDAAYPGVTYEMADNVARIRLNRPEVRNAQSLPLLQALDAAFTRATQDSEVKVIVLSGAGEAFSSGHDLGTPEQAGALLGFAQGQSAVEAVFEYSFRYFLEYSLRWRDIPKPTIAQVHGWCMFGGWMLAAPMDLVIAADDARFMTGFLQFFSLPYDIGVRKAKEIMFMPRQIGAQEAHDLGFVSKVVPRDRLEEETDEVARRIAAMPLFYLRLAKLAANGVQDAAGFRNAVTAANAQQLMTYLDELQQTMGPNLGAPTGGESGDREKRRPMVDWILSNES